MTGPATLSRLSESSWAGAVALAAGPVVVLATGPAGVLATGPAAVLATGLAAAPLRFPLGPSAVAVGALAPSTLAPTAAAPPLACPPESSAPAVSGNEPGQVRGELVDQLAADLHHDAAAELARPVTFIVVCMVTSVPSPEASGARDARTVAAAVPAPRVSLPEASTTTGGRRDRAQ